MSRPFPSLLSSLAAFGVAAIALLPAQNRAVVPAVCADLPGNAALSLPLRWSHGTLQVRVDPVLLPNLGTAITGLRLRRPSFLAEPAYPALQRTLTIRGGFDTRAGYTAAGISPSRVFNAPPNVATLFGPAQVSIPATPATGPTSQTGDEFLAVQFTTPLTVGPGTLFLEFEAGDAPFQVVPDHWVDAVWFDDGIENGYAVSLGDGSCTSRSAPTELAWNDPGTGPLAGGTATLRLTGSKPSEVAFLWFGFDPVPRATTSSYVGFGGSLTAIDPTLVGCHQWAPIDVTVVRVADAGGNAAFTFSLPSGGAMVGMEVGVQAAWFDSSRAGLPISVSNGVGLVLTRTGVGNKAACVYFPGTATWSPFEPYIGQMPVLVLEHN
ncbi:MAG: hypothetical protein KDE27_31260 [Planctomycetes bacterium]|nr:hypothetical protein [Planctomycetota bacterium]